MAGLISVGLSAWWLTSFVTTQKYTNSMGYTNDPVNTLHDIFTTLGWFTSGGGAAGDRWVIVLAIIALIVAFWVRDRLGMILTTLTVLSIGAFVFDPQNVIWNERLVPFWFITIHLSAGWLFGYVLMRWAKRSLGRTRSLLGADRREPLQLRARSRSPAPNRSTSGSRSTADRHAASRGRPSSRRRIARERRRRRRRVALATRRGLRATVIILILGLLTTVPGLIPQVASALSLNTIGQPGLELGAVELLGLSGQGLVARVQRPHDDHGPGRRNSTAAVARCGSTTRTRTASGRPRR